MSITLNQLPRQHLSTLFTLFDKPAESAELSKSTDPVLTELAKIQIYDHIPEVGALIADARIFCSLVTAQNQEKLKSLVCRITGTIKRLIRQQDNIQKREILADKLVQETLLMHFPEDALAELESFPLAIKIVPQAVRFVQKLMSISSVETLYSEDERVYIIDNALLIPEHLFLLLAIEMPEWDIFEGLDKEVAVEIKKLTSSQIVCFLKGETAYLLAKEQHIRLMSCIGSVINKIPRKWFTTLSFYLSTFYSPTEPLLLNAIMHNTNKEVQKKLAYFLSEEYRNILEKLHLVAEQKEGIKALEIVEDTVCNYSRGFELLKLYLLSAHHLNGRLSVWIGLKLFYTGAFSEVRVPGVKRTIPKGEELLDLLITIYKNIAERSLTEARELLRELYKLLEISSLDANTQMDLALICVWNVACVASCKEPRTAIEIVHEYPEDSQTILMKVFETLGYRDPDLGLKVLLMVEEKFRDMATQYLANSCAENDPDKAITIALKIESKKYRERVLINIFTIVLGQYPGLEDSLKKKYTISDSLVMRYRFASAMVAYIENDNRDKDSLYIENILKLCNTWTDIEQREKHIVSLIGIVAYQNMPDAQKLMLEKLTLKTMINHARAKIALVCMRQDVSIQAVKYLKAIDEGKRKQRVKAKMFSEKYRESITVELIEYLLDDDGDGFLSTISSADRDFLIDKLEEKYMYDKAEMLKKKVVL